MRRAGPARALPDRDVRPPRGPPGSPHRQGLGQVQRGGQPGRGGHQGRISEDPQGGVDRQESGRSVV